MRHRPLTLHARKELLDENGSPRTVACARVLGGGLGCDLFWRLDDKQVPGHQDSSSAAPGAAARAFECLAPLRWVATLHQAYDDSRSPSPLFATPIAANATSASSKQSALTAGGSFPPVEVGAFEARFSTRADPPECSRVVLARNSRAAGATRWRSRRASARDSLSASPAHARKKARRRTPAPRRALPAARSA